MATIDDDRAQLILVGALGLAVTLVALALILNSVIYTQNLATRTVESGVNDGVVTNQEVRRGAGGVLDGVNDPNSAKDYGTLNSEFKGAGGELDEWNGIVSRHKSFKGASLRTEVTTSGPGPEIYNGVRIVDDDSSTTFEPRTASPNPPDATGSVDWTVAADVRVRSMTFTVHSVSTSPSNNDVEDELSDGTRLDSNQADFFYVDLTEPGSSANPVWSIAMYGDGSGDIKLAVYDHNANEFTVCSTTPVATPVRVDISSGQINNVDCPALADISAYSGSYDVDFANADRAEGTYELIVDRTVDDDDLTTEVGALTGEVDRLNYGNHCSGPTYWDPDSGISGNTPYVLPALYSADISIEYQNANIEYNSRVATSPGELNQDVSHPQVTDFSITDQSVSGLAEFSVDVTVSDPNGDLNGVNIELIRSGTTVDTATDSSISGETASVTLIVDESVTLPGDYDIKITVTDSSGEQRSVTQSHKAESGGDDSGCPP